MKKTHLCTAVAIGLLALSGSAAAITAAEANATIPFSFANPGARSLAMGGAFLGAADDATAALVNPAGLTRLGLEQQFSVEVRRYALETPFPAGGTVGTSPFDLTGIDYDNDSDNQDDLSYLAWVLPQDRWAIGLYRHSMVNYQGGYSSESIDYTGALEGFFIRPLSTETDLEVVTYGASFAFNLTDQISIGAGVAYNDFELDSLQQRFSQDGSVLANAQGQRGDDTDISYNFGVLFQATDGFSIGMAYRSAPEFSYRYVNYAFAVNDEPLDAPVELANATTPFKAPDVFGIGIKWKATDRLSINADINRIGYSNLTEQVDNPFFSGAILDSVEFDSLITRSVHVDNVIEPRFGFEYLLSADEVPVFLRGGAWREKKHTLSFENDPDSPSFTDPVSAAAYAALFSAGDDQNHMSIGLGAAFESFQIDFGYDHSDTLDTLSLSGVYRF